MNFNKPEPRRPYYFASKEDARAFQELTKRLRIIGSPTMRKTLATLRDGKATLVDTRHSEGFTVWVQPYAFVDQIDIAEAAKRIGNISAPHAP